MNKYLFEDWLRNRLDDLPAEELDRVVAFYLDAIDERMEDGMTEEEAIHDLGEPESLLAGIRASLPEYVTYTPVRQIRQKTMSRRKWVMAGLIAAVLGVALPVVLIILSAAPQSGIIYSETPVVEPIPEIFSSSYGFDASTLEKVTVSATFGNVQVEPSENGEVQIIGDASLFDATRRGNTLYIENVESDIILQIPYTVKLDIKCDMGDAVLYEVAPQTLQVSCDLGSITLFGVSAVNSITLEADVGNIEGTLRGAQTDYEIDVEVDLGDTNLSDSYHSGSEEIKLTATADLGSIHLEFEE